MTRDTPAVSPTDLDLRVRYPDGTGAATSGICPGLTEYLAR